MAPEVGLEPTTKRLTAARSTAELLGNGLPICAYVEPGEFQSGSQTTYYSIASLATTTTLQQYPLSGVILSPDCIGAKNLTVSSPRQDCHAKFTPSEILQSLCSFRMTKSEGFPQNDTRRRARDDRERTLGLFLHFVQDSLRSLRMTGGLGFYACHCITVSASPL